MTMTSANFSNNSPYKISKPRISLLEDNALIFSTLKTSPAISFSCSAEVSNNYYISLYCQGTSHSGQDIRLDILESRITKLESEPKSSEAELQLEYLSQLADNSSLMITLSIKSELDDTQDERNSSTHFVNFYRTPPTRLEPLVARNNWMTDISYAIGHMRLQELILPGAHNAGVDQDNCHFPDELWGACQDYTFDYQLEHGIRVLDCRVKDIDPGNGLFQFRHGSYHSWHVLSDLTDQVKAFLDQHPEEIIILDFHEFQGGASFDYARFGSQINYGIGWRLLPPEANKMTINEIRTMWPKRRVALCCDPVPHAFNWPKIPHRWSGKSTINTEELNNWINSVMQDPPNQQLWSLSATAYNLFTGPVRISANDKVFTDLFTPLHTPAPGVNFKGNIINVDFFQNTNVVDNCIYINRMRGALPDTIPPTMPDTPAISNLTTSSATVVWGESIDNNVVSGYLLTLNNDPPILITGTTHTFTGLVDATSYIVEIKAKDAAGNYSLPAFVKFKLEDDTAPGKPKNAHYILLSKTSAKITWTAPADNVAVVGYVLTVNDAPPITVTETSHIFSKLKELTAYVIKIQAKDSAENLSPAALVIFVTLGNFPPSQPEDPIVVKTSPTSMLVSWTPSTDIGGGKVVGYTISVDGAPPITIEETLYGFDGLPEGAWHTIEIKAVDNGGQYSIPAHAWFNSNSHLIPSVPLHFGSWSGYPPIITWRAPAFPENLTGYSVAIIGPSNQPMIHKTTETTLKPGLLPNRTFRVEVTAYNSFGSSYPLFGSVST